MSRRLKNTERNVAMSHQYRDKDLKINDLHGTKILDGCTNCDSILGVTKGLKENKGGSKINTPPGPDHTGDRGPAVNPSS